MYNILAACCAGMTFQLPPETIARGIEACAGVPGRFERVDEGQPFAVVVDYSHTEDALRNAISVARTLNAKRVITLFGCGGDRDRAKRPLMGQAAGELSDLVVLTSDNPRSEEPLQIMNDALVGLRRTNTRTIVEPDRAAAIRKAIEEAHAGDVVILAGKGHETYQIFRDRTIHFDDREVAREALRSFGFGNRGSEASGFMTLSITAIAEMVGAAIPRHDDETVSGWSIDSRTTNPGDCFFALRGPKNDGHDYVENVVEKGAAVAVVERPVDDAKILQLVVPDALAAMQQLGAQGARALGRDRGRRNGQRGEDHDERRHREPAER